MEQNTGRRRSSRLAVKGVTSPSRTESTCEKPAKSVENPKPYKRSKCKIAEVSLSHAKKAKTTEEKEDNKSEIVENNLIDVDMENKEEVADTNTVSEEAVFKEAVSEKTVSQKIESEAADEPVKNDNTEPLNNDVSQDTESKPDPVIVTQNSNGNDDKEEEIFEEKLKNDVDVIKDVTPNGEVNEVESTNGNELEAVEQNNGDIKTDLKAAVTATIPTANTILSNNDASELENVSETMNVTPDDNDDVDLRRVVVPYMSIVRLMLIKNI